MKLPRYAYFEGRIVPYSEAKVGVMTHALNYGTGAFAGLRGYWNSDEEQLFLFRPIDHFIRLLDSAHILCAEVDFTPEMLHDIAVQLLQEEGLREDCYVRPIIYKADETIGVRLHDLRDELTMFAVPFSRYVERDEAAHATFSSWRRIDDNAIPARGKITGAYVNSALIKTDALRAGFDEALALTDQGHVSEGSAENIFMLRNGVLITPSVTENILEGITRRTIIALARQELGLDVIERPIDRTEVYLCTELIMTGTAAQVTVVTHVDHRPIGEGRMGPVAAELRKLYDRVVRGKMPKYRSWTTPIYVKEPASAV